MTISVFGFFKIGIGPSSSYTVDPMRTAASFTAALHQRQVLSAVRRLEMRLYGLLSVTGVDHGTDRAVIMGLMGEWPDRIDPTQIASCMAMLFDSGLLQLNDRAVVPFDWVRDMCLLDENLSYHPNAMTLVAYDEQGKPHQETYYSVGRSFVVDMAQAASGQLDQDRTVLPYDSFSAEGPLLLCRHHNLRVSELMLANKRIQRSKTNIREGLRCIWQAMHDCIDNGLRNEGILLGGLNVQRRATRLHHNLQEIGEPNVIGSTLSAMKWANLFALTVNEENTAGRRVVTAPTNGAAGIIPVVLHYYMKFDPDTQDHDVVGYLLAVAAVGILCKKNVSISGTEVGCQGEAGSARAMATVGLAEVLGATLMQVGNAVEIDLEHNLGLTYDPVGESVQVLRIERNVIVTVKAINMARITLRGDDQHFISLDKVIRTMRDTGANMHDKYKETSRGGLAVNAIEC